MRVSQKFLGDLCVGSPRSPDVGFLNAGTLPFTQPLLPLCFDHCLLMKSRCVLSLFLCFGLCVLILSKAHRNLLLHFPSFTSDGSFSVTAATYFMMQTLNLSRCPWWVKCGSVDRKAYCVKKERLHGPREVSISNFHIQFARQTVQRPLRDRARFLLQSPLSALRSIFLRCCRWWEMPERFWMATRLVETKIKTENNSQALSFGETLPGHSLLVQFLHVCYGMTFVVI